MAIFDGCDMGCDDFGRVVFQPVANRHSRRRSDGAVGVVDDLWSIRVPRPSLREHVPNDRQLLRWNDLLVFGIPAFFLLSIGLGMLFLRVFSFSSVLLGFVVGSMLIVGYGCLIFARDVDAGG